MERGWCLLIFSIFLVIQVQDTVAESHFLNEWVAHIEGGLEHAIDVAKRSGFEVVGEMPHFENHYILKHAEVPHRSKRSADHHTRKLADHVDVKWVEQQETRERSKRGFIDDHNRPRRACSSVHDPLYSEQWYMGCLDTDPRDQRSAKGVVTMGIEDAWDRGFTGKGVVTSIVDDGLEKDHPDLKKNYDPEASCDINGNDTDPTPRYDHTNENSHGTRCAGVVAMQGDNEVCGIGVAYNCKIGGVRMLDGQVTDLVEAQAFIHANQHVDIISVSWGPTDDGKLLDGPRKLAKQMIAKAIQEGRGGKGTIYVWASGDGGADDDCSCDGYSSSIYSIGVNSATREGGMPWYSEACPSTFTTTYSSSDDVGVVSSDLRKKCTTKHSGTSASAPMAAGIVALALEANPDLTWRDMQHIVVLASKPGPLIRNEGWYNNAAGFCVNRAFGFGLINAKNMVDLASEWIPVPEQTKCEVSLDPTFVLSQELSSGKSVELIFTTDGCGGADSQIISVEHVVLNFTVKYSRRGALSIVGTSPSGTQTKFLERRPKDASEEGFKGWEITSVHTWGENPTGDWVFRVKDEGLDGSQKGTLENAKLILYGTKIPPIYPRTVSCDVKSPTATQTVDIPADFSDNMAEGFLFGNIRLPKFLFPFKMPSIWQLMPKIRWQK